MPDFTHLIPQPEVECDMGIEVVNAVFGEFHRRLDIANKKIAEQELKKIRLLEEIRQIDIEVSELTGSLVLRYRRQASDA